MFSLFIASLNFYYSLITISIIGMVYIIIRNIYLSYKQERENIKQALQKTQASLSLTKNFSCYTKPNETKSKKSTPIKPTQNKKNTPITNKKSNKNDTSAAASTTKKTKESVEHLNRLAEISRLTKRAEVLIAQKQYKEAKKFMIQALSYDETHKKSLETIAQIYLSLEQYSKAIFFLDNFFKYHKETASTCNNYALAHFYTKDFPTTISYYSKAIALEPDNAVRYENLGKVFLALENYEDASKCYIEASKLDAKNIEYHKIIATCLKKSTKYEEAKHWYEKILEFSPYDKETLNALENLKKLGF